MKSFTASHKFLSFRILGSIAVLVVALSACRATVLLNPDHARSVPLVAKVLTINMQGPVEDTWVEFNHGAALTVVLIIDSATDIWWEKPHSTRLLFCGDSNSILKDAVHTNVLLTYDPSSPNGTTDCLKLIRVDPLEDNSPWETAISGPQKIPLRSER